MDNNIFELLMLLFVIITTILRFFKGRKVQKKRSQLVALAPLINASVDSGRQSISGKIDEVSFKVKYEPQAETSSARIDVILNKKLPFSMEVNSRTTQFDHQQAVENGEFILEERKFDESLRLFDVLRLF